MLPTKTGGIFSSDYIQDIQTNLQEPVQNGSETESIKVKLMVLEKWLRHGMSRFSKENLQIFLGRLMQYTEKHNLRSLGDIQRILTRIKLNSKEKLQDDERKLANYFHNFQNDLAHIKLIQHCFDEEIYQYLYRHYYDPTADNSRRLSRDKKSIKDMRRVSFEDVAEEPEVSPRQLGVTTLDIIKGDEKQKLSVIVHELTDIIKRWENLIPEEEQPINEEDFDPDSEYELHHLSNFEQYEVILRLVPDIFTKCHKCIELCKQWLRLAHKVYPSLPIRRPKTPVKTPDPTPSKRISYNEPVKSRSARANLETNSFEDSTPPSRPVRPFTSKPRRDSSLSNTGRDSSSSKASARQRIVIKKPRVAKFKPDQAVINKEKSISDINGHNMNSMEDLIDEGNQSIKSLHQSIPIISTTIHEEGNRLSSIENYDDIPDDGSQVSGSLSSPISSPTPSPEPCHLTENGYNYLVIKLREINRNIDDLETNLDNYRYELDALHSRQERLMTLQSKKNTAKQQLEALKRRHHTAVIMLKEQQRDFDSAISGTSKFFELQQSTEEIKYRVQVADNEMKMLRFQIDVIDQDYELELEMNPNFETFASDLKADIMETEKLLEEEQHDKRQIEKEIAMTKPTPENLVLNNLTPRRQSKDSSLRSLSRCSETLSESDSTYLKSGKGGTSSDRYEEVTLGSSPTNGQSSQAWEHLKF